MWNHRAIHRESGLHPRIAGCVYALRAPAAIYKRKRFCRGTHGNLLLGRPIGFTSGESWTGCLNVPLCHRHRNHWSNRNAVIIGSFVALVIGLAALIVLIDNLPSRELQTDVGLLGFFCGFVVWIFFALVVDLGKIRPLEITAVSIVLGGVAPGFVKAAKKAGCTFEPQLHGESRSRWRPKTAKRSGVQSDSAIDSNVAEAAPKPRDSIRE